MDSLLLLAISIILYFIAEKYFSKKEGEFTVYGTSGSIICIFSAFLLILSLLMSIDSWIKLMYYGIE